MTSRASVVSSEASVVFSASVKKASSDPAAVTSA
jgi:hypothetical protein